MVVMSSGLSRVLSWLRVLWILSLCFMLMCLVVFVSSVDLVGECIVLFVCLVSISTQVVVRFVLFRNGVMVSRGMFIVVSA